MDDLQWLFAQLANDLWPEMGGLSRSESDVLVITKHGADACLAGAACYAADAGLSLLNSRERSDGFHFLDAYEYYEQLTAPLEAAESALAVARMAPVSTPVWSWAFPPVSRLTLRVALHVRASKFFRLGLGALQVG